MKNSILLVVLSPLIFALIVFLLLLIGLLSPFLFVIVMFILIKQEQRKDSIMKRRAYHGTGVINNQKKGTEYRP
jgi:hypothetical protein